MNPLHSPLPFFTYIDIIKCLTFENMGEYFKVLLKHFFQEKNIKFSPHASTRENVMVRTALSSVQKAAAQPPPRKDARTKLSNPGDQEGSTYSRHNEFSEVTFCLSINQKHGALLKRIQSKKWRALALISIIRTLRELLMETLSFASSLRKVGN